MVEHLVLFKLKPETTPEQRRELLEGLRGLKASVPGIIDLSCGENFCERAQGFDVGLVVRFADRAALEAYGPHPNHQDVVQNLVRPISADVLAVDYEF